jgi:preprotein translocase subunit SecA
VHPWLNKSIEKAQKKVEERNFEVRKHLLDYDDVLNEQRKFIYSRRDEIISDPNLKERVIATAGEILQEYLDNYQKVADNPFAGAQYLLNALKESLFFEPVVKIEEIAAMKPPEVAEAIHAELVGNIQEKANELGEEVLNRFIMFEYLRNIDSRWQDHLENLEALREAVYLRAYSQKNPLLEYKLEGFQIFDDMLVDIKTGIAKKIFRVKIQKAPDRQLAGRATPAGIQASHNAMGQFSVSSNAEPAAASRPQNAQVKRTVPKVGRNDTCPCGSGLKYKYCHGK